MPNTLLSEPELQLSEKVIGAVARRRCLSIEEAEDFSSWAKLRLIEEGRAILDRFEGRSSMSTYLTTVVLNLFRDYRIAKWGKYRPSAAARRLGTVAVRLEMLLARDGLSFDEAVEVLRRNEGARESVEELERFAAQLPQRAPRKFEGADALERLAASERTDDRAVAGEAAATGRRLGAALRDALAALAPEDRLILKLHVEDGFSVAQVARSLHLEQKPLYRRLERLTRTLRHDLEDRGFQRQDIDAVVEWEADVRVDYQLGEEKRPAGPSHQESGR